MSRPVGGGLATGVIALLGLLSSRPVRAADDLRDVASRVEGAWRAAGATVSRRDARFVMEDETATIELGHHLHAHADPDGRARDTSPDCVRVALIAARGVSFHVTGVSQVDEEPTPIASAAGVVELHGCGVVPDVVQLKADSGRGALEIVIASGPSALPPVSAILLERTGGVLPSAPEPGPLPPLPPPAARALAAEARLLGDGFVASPELTWPAGEDGKGGGDVLLPEGCHHLELFAAEPRARDARRTRLDLDGAIRRTDGDHDVIAEDQSIAPDVRLDACVAMATRVRVTFEGAPRGGPVLLSHVTHPLPAHLPAAWSPELRARLASVMLVHHAQSLPADAVLLARGASGNTPVPVNAEPGACYVAVAALDRGAVRGHGVALRVTVGGRVAQDDQGAREDAALVAFCARDAAFARMEVDARSAASGWSAAVFRILGGAWSSGP